jgi:hypothetical protein
LFLSRIRNNDEIMWAVDGIGEFRELRQRQREQLLNEIEIRIPGAKRYQNWRDMGLHTFSLFALGLSAIRTDQVLRLTGATIAPRPGVVEAGVPGGHSLQGPLRFACLTLRRTQHWPHHPLSETQTEVARRNCSSQSSWKPPVSWWLSTQIDLWAKRGESITLALGIRGCEGHGANYYIAAVEHLERTPTVRFIQDPIRLRIQEHHATEYAIRRDHWESAATELE